LAQRELVSFCLCRSDQAGDGYFSPRSIHDRTPSSPKATLAANIELPAAGMLDMLLRLLERGEK
jgi:hypothetical protein